MMKMPKIWDILKRFKDLCRLNGWKTSESHDWVKIDDKYHNFLWARNIHPSSFKSIVTNSKCVVREGLSYRVVKASYTAWLFSETPSKNLVETISKNPDFSKRIALYDVSSLVEGKKLCVKLNQTDSPIFQEFENFLKDEFEVRLQPLFKSKVDSENYTVARLAQ